MNANELIAIKLTALYYKNGKLPHKKHKSIGNIYYTNITHIGNSFYFTRWIDSDNFQIKVCDDDLRIDRKQAIKEVWNDLTNDEKELVMGMVLGSKDR